MWAAGDRAAALAQALKNSQDAIAGKAVQTPQTGKKSVYGQDCIFVANGAPAAAPSFFLAHNTQHRKWDESVYYQKRQISLCRAVQEHQRL